MSLVAVVTGAAGGIGAATTRMLVQSGWQVLGVDLDPVPQADGVVGHRADLSDPAAVAAAAAAALELGDVAAVVHAAAVQVLGGAGTVSDDDWSRTLAVNLLAVDRLVGGVRDSLVATRGSVVVVSSVHAVATTAGIVAYATSKAAVEGWVRAAALDLAPEVRVNSVRPGAVDTPMLRAGLARRPEDGTTEEALAVLAAAVPLRTIIDPDDVARAVLALVDLTHPLPMTGSALTIDAGALTGLSTE